MNKIKLNLMVLEDDINVATDLKNQFQANDQRFNPVWVTNVAAAKREFSSRLFHAVSLDQRIPQSEATKPYETDDANFSAILSAYSATQPIATGVVLTGFGSIAPAVDAEKHGLKYLQKGPNAVNDWKAELNRIRKEYFHSVLLNRGVSKLPNALARSIQQFRDQEHPRIKLLAARDILENSVRMLTSLLAMIALADPLLHRPALDAIQTLYERDRTNAEWIGALENLVNRIKGGADPVTNSAGTEVQRFLFGGSMSFLTAVDILHRLRNELAHDRLQKVETYNAILSEHQAAIQGLIESCFLFSIHPIIGHLERRHVASGLPLYRAHDYRGDSLNPPSIDVRCDDNVVRGELEWALMKEPGISTRLFSLSPLLKAVVDHESQQTGLYLLDNPKRGEYRELSTGRRYMANEKEKLEIRDFFRA